MILYISQFVQGSSEIEFSNARALICTEKAINVILSEETNATMLKNLRPYREAYVDVIEELENCNGMRYNRLEF